ncbi:MAG: GNAT family N-acetyltransferase [Candidatus Hodarchaeota archaeon]
MKQYTDDSGEGMIKDLEFRRLSLDDLPAIKNMSDTVGPLNDPSIGEEAESIIPKSASYLYGAFKENKLVGLGCLTSKTKNYAWIEYIRVHGKHQKKGVGTALFGYGEIIARNKGAKIVAYSTVTGNKGSCRVGEKLGFHQAVEMHSFYIKTQDCPELDETYRNQKPLLIEEALDFLRKMPNGPKDEICTAWNFDPLEKEYFENQDCMTFYALGEAVLLERYFRDGNTNQIICALSALYGTQKDAHELLLGFIKRNVDKPARGLLCLCSEDLISIVLKTGFQYATIWNGERNIIVLFKKYLS